LLPGRAQRSGQRIFCRFGHGLLRRGSRSRGFISGGGSTIFQAVLSDAAALCHGRRYFGWINDFLSAPRHDISPYLGSVGSFFSSRSLSRGAGTDLVLSFYRRGAECSTRCLMGAFSMEIFLWQSVKFV